MGIFISIIVALICFWVAQELGKAFGIAAGIGFLVLILVIAILVYFLWPIVVAMLPYVLVVGAIVLVYRLIRARAPTPPPAT